MWITILHMLQALPFGVATLLKLIDCMTYMYETHTMHTILQHYMIKHACVLYARDTRAYSADIITIHMYIVFMQRARVNFHIE